MAVTGWKLGGERVGWSENGYPHWWRGRQRVWRKMKEAKKRRNDGLKQVTFQRFDGVGYQGLCCAKVHFYCAMKIDRY